MTIYVHKVQSLSYSGSAQFREARRTRLRVSSSSLSITQQMSDQFFHDSAKMFNSRNLCRNRTERAKAHLVERTVRNEHMRRSRELECSDFTERSGAESRKNWKKRKKRNLINSLPSLEAGHPFIVISISAALTDKIQLITLVFSESEKRRQRAAMNQKQKKKRKERGLHWKWAKNQNISNPDDNPRVHLCWPEACAFTKVNCFSHFFFFH